MKYLAAITIVILCLATVANAESFFGLSMGGANFGVSVQNDGAIARRAARRAARGRVVYASGASSGFSGGYGASSGMQGGYAVGASSGFQGGASNGFSGGYGASPVYAAPARRVVYRAAPRRVVYRGYGGSPCPPGMNCP